MTPPAASGAHRLGTAAPNSDARKIDAVVVLATAAERRRSHSLTVAAGALVLQLPLHVAAAGVVPPITALLLLLVLVAIAGQALLYQKCLFRQPRLSVLCKSSTSSPLSPPARGRLWMQTLPLLHTPLTLLAKTVFVATSEKLSFVPTFLTFKSFILTCC